MGIRIGVVGTGRLGREHVRVLGGLSGVDFVGCHDVVTGRAAEVARATGATAFDSFDSLLESVDAVSIVVPTSEHLAVGLKALERGADVFVEKPIAASAEEAEKLIAAAHTGGRILQVGHVERFNSAVEAMMDHIESPQFIEIHRLAPFNTRGTDISVIGDLMIHDLDLLAHFLSERPIEIRAKGASILTDAPDIVNVRIAFPGGCVANITASRVSETPMRKVRVFSRNSYISIDLLRGVATRYRKAPDADANLARLREKADGHDQLNLSDFVSVETVQPDHIEPLSKELDAFRRSVVTREAPPVTGEDGLRAVQLATEILACMEEGVS